MGISATFEYICDTISRSYKQKQKKKKFKHMQTVNLKVRICDGCELKVKKASSSLTGMYLYYCLFALFYLMFNFINAGCA